MAFVVEDGNGLTTANAYISVDFANTYHSDRGQTQWSGSATNKQRAIVRATDYIDKRFGTKFRGTRTLKTQALEWPRVDAIDDDEYELTVEDQVPRQLQKACAEYALRALLVMTQDLAPDNPSGVSGNLSASSDSVTGPGGAGVSRSRSYDTGGSNRAAQSDLVSDSKIPEYPAADLWLAELLKSSTIRRLRRA